MSKENLDALVLAAALISDYIEEDALLEFCSRLWEMPLLSGGIRIPGAPSIVIDNSAGPAIEDLLRDNSKVPDAFIFANDEMAVQGVKMLKDQGIEVPNTSFPRS